MQVLCDNTHKEYIWKDFVEFSDVVYPVKDLFNILDSFFRVPISIIITDVQGRILYINKDYADFLRLRQADLIGKVVDDVVPNSRVSVIIASGKPEINQVHTYSNGTKSIVNRLPIFDKEGNVKGCFGIIAFKSMEELKELAEINMCLKTKLDAYQNEIKGIYRAKYSFEDIIGEGQAVKQKKAMAQRYARGNAPILITGETGTGKELWAHAIHNVSPRKDNPFISVNCAAVPENLFESELFGYEEGAFTGAKKGGKLGKFQLAKGGTIFLDEIGDMPLNMQVKILRVLQEKEIEKVGGSTEQIDFRIIAATNVDLQQAVNKGKFREDLYYRLNIFSIKLPALREHPEDIELLAKNFITKCCNNNGIVKTIDAQAMESLKRHSWPGNIRQLGALIERLVVSTEASVIKATDLPEHILMEPGLKLQQGNKLDHLLAQVEKEYIIKALEICNNSKSDAARYLGIARSRLYRKMEAYNIL